MTNKIILFIISTFLLIACNSSEPAISRDDLLNTAVASIIETQTAQATPLQEATQPATKLVQPPSQISGPTGEEYAWNYLATQDSGGVSITIGRVLITEKANVPLDLSSMEIFNDKPVVVEIILIVENKTSATVGLYPNQGQARLNSEIVDIVAYTSVGDFGTKYSGDVLPGAKLIGRLRIGSKKTTPDEINSLTIFIPAPRDQNFQSIGVDYNFVLDLSQKQFVPLPDELK